MQYLGIDSDVLSYYQPFCPGVPGQIPIICCIIASTLSHFTYTLNIESQYYHNICSSTTPEAIQNSIVDGPPFCDGTVDGTDLFLYYGKGDNTRRIDFDNHTEAQIKELANACDAATFGVNQQNVLDESYRKAGKMDSNNFSINFNPYNSGIIDIARTSLNINRDVYAELNKLNVYGPGSFFKAHQDTPRGERMFGSLVIILPTIYEGGSLVLRDKGKEWTVDPFLRVEHETNVADNDLAVGNTSRLGYVAFYGDVEHEVLEVTSGYCITITYNLYLTTSQTASRSSIFSTSALKTSLQELLNDPSFLPNGGHIGFSLSREYPVNLKTALSSILENLKGNDDAIVKACRDLSLEVLAWVLYEDKSLTEDNMVLLDHILDLMKDEDMEPVQDHIGIIDHLEETYGAFPIVLVEPTYRMSRDEEERGWDWDYMKIFRMMDMLDNTAYKQAFQAYGNEPTIDFIYATVCLVVDIVPVDSRRV
ncbi:hypothetical protein ABKN59_007227 [Abortiporus biennis]